MEKPDNSLDQALDYLRYGYFEGALDLTANSRARALERSLVEWLARVYLGGGDRPSDILTGVAREYYRQAEAGFGLPEFALLQMEAGKIAKHHRPDVFRKIKQFATEQSGALGQFHAVPMIRLCRIACEEMRTQEDGAMLANIALGGRPYAVRADEISSLANCLAALNAPLSIWMSWFSRFYQTLKFTIHRREHFIENYDSVASSWAIGQESDLEAVLASAVELAPAGFASCAAEISKAYGAQELARVITDRWMSSNNLKTAAQHSQLKNWWASDDAMSLRYPWYQMLSDGEKGWLLKAESGLAGIFGIPEYSTELAQWWRAVESVLEREVRIPLHEHYKLNADWADEDRKWLDDNSSAGKRQREDRELFLQIAKGCPMGLADLIKLTNKIKQPAKPAHSRLRAEAVRWFMGAEPEFSSIIHLLSRRPFYRIDSSDMDAFIKAYRNGPSHTRTSAFQEAIAGREVAIELLGRVYSPRLRRMGF